MGDLGSGREFREATGTITPAMVIDERFAVWAHYEVYANSEAVLLDGNGTEIARFDQFDAADIARKLP